MFIFSEGSRWIMSGNRESGLGVPGASGTPAAVWLVTVPLRFVKRPNTIPNGKFAHFLRFPMISYDLGCRFSYDLALPKVKIIGFPSKK